MLSLIRNLIIILALVIGLAFGFYNFNPTHVDFLWAATDAPLSVLMALSFLLGLVIAMLLFGLRLLSLKARLTKTRRELKNAENELSRYQTS